MFEEINRLAIKLYSGCNMNCCYCFQSFDEKYKPKIFKDNDKLLKFIQQLPLANKVIVTFCGGEMTLRPDLIKDCIKTVFTKIERMIEVKFEYAIITNGTNLDTLFELFDDHFLNPSLCNFSWAGLYSVSLSRKSLGKYDDQYFLNAIKRLGQSIYNDRLSVVQALTPDTIPYLYESFKYCLDNNVTNIGYYPIHEASYDNDFCQIFSQQLDKILSMVSKTTIGVNFFNLEMMNCGQSNPLYFTCTKLGYNYYINPYGEIYPCIYFGDNKAYKLGDLDNGIDNAKQQAFIDDYLHYPNCDYRNCKCSFCGECPAACYVNNGNMNHKFKNLCQIRKIEQALFNKHKKNIIENPYLLNVYSKEDAIKNNKNLIMKSCDFSKVYSEIHPPHIDFIRNW